FASSWSDGRREWLFDHIMFRRGRCFRGPSRYREDNMTPSQFAAAGGALLVALVGSPSAADVVSDWNTAVIPPPPELKEVTIDPSTTALLFLDIMKGGCTARPRCVAAVPNMKRLHEAARSHNMVVWYSLVGSNGKATPDDIMDPAIKPRAGE